MAINTTRRATENRLIGNPKSDVNAICLLTNGDVRRFFTFLKSKMLQKNDAVKQTIEVVTEICLKS